MQLLILFVLLTFSLKAYCQHKYVCSLKQQYNEIVKTFSEDEILFFNHIEEDEFMDGNKAALIEEYIDTLNKDKILNTQFVVGSKSLGINKYIGITHGEFYNDTMIVNIGYPFGNEEIVHRVGKENFVITFTEHYKHDKILKHDENDDPTNELTVKVEVEAFHYCKDGKTVYGYSKFTTEPYFRLDQFNSTQYLQIQRTYQYYFKFDQE